ncbi:regulator of complement activation group 2 gene 1 [Plectropomus leopardus]|uniref:regulator of complement activation group 2 gene 1 n=1 Tax=Plectropomus leopardus TaxID=160734 RepID=UPI001C4C0DD0|nr:regulator of complement activation group 2 gene 1 [Plectropomus leopardus]
MGLTSLLLLSSLGLFVRTQAQSCSRPEGGDNMVLGDDHILLQTFPDGTKVTFACEVGYESAGGSPSITCTAGSWSPLRLTCRNATFSPIKEHYNYGEVVQYTCPKDYTLNGSKSLSCSASGEFDARPPVCINVQCKEPEIDFAEQIAGSRVPHRHMASVTFACKSGYTMKGSGTLTCGIDSQWSPRPSTVKCEAIPTTKPPTTPTTTTTTPAPPTTTPRPDTKKPPAHTTAKTTPLTVTLDPGTTPGNGGNSLAIGLGVVLTSLFLIGAGIGLYYYGVPGFIRKKRGSRSGIPDNVVPKDGEDLALS